jgi:S-adenosylmethionine hydrolase
MSFEPCGVITLTTDFGHKGPYVASMKGVMLSRFAGARIVDLTHEIVVHWPAEAGFWLERSYRYFPRGTVHVAVVDPGVGTERHIIAAEHDEHVFIAPDNGLLTPLLSRSESIVHNVDLAKLGKLGLAEPSATFHGRDIFAPITAEIAAGRAKVADLGPTAKELVPSWVEEPTVSEEKVEGVVITVDNFGNAITNIDDRLLERFEKPIVHVSGRDIRFFRTYADVTPGDYLSMINSFGVLEIARSERSAADGLGVERGAPVTVSQER